jgi:DNA-directed RNA polymerase subunit RPC12/RpoP
MGCICVDCNREVKLKQAESIRCRECGHRYLWKKRMDKIVQFEAW